ncbi:transcriptional regulator domain-containing protein [Thermodesulfobacteriota bacterium]
MGKPEWRNPKDYAWVVNLTPSQLAWEFLRRNPDYLKEYDRHCRAFYRRGNHRQRSHSLLPIHSPSMSYSMTGMERLMHQ